jgi:hypothetical protein
MQAGGSWLSGVFQCLSQDVTLIMHSFSTSVGFGGFKIDRLVADRAFDFWLSRERHKAPRNLLVAVDILQYSLSRQYQNSTRAG